ncbi:protein SYM1-like [Anarrhichthys ocellatus]|uniref:protein SYM1-like n=1 Tax=Anarrhichthys ocellatus TaxID=433405 RepID=UPI0012EE3731|nr:protein SYM1-like [Anarrhichthys ocellatus]
MRGSYWTALKMNWKVWTPFQFININFVPVQFRVLFANSVALFCGPFWFLLVVVCTGYGSTPELRKRFWRPKKRPTMEPWSIRLTQLELHAMPLMGWLLQDR